MLLVNVGKCNNEIGLNLKEISLNTKVLLTGKWMDVLKGRTERTDFPNGLWPYNMRLTTSD